MFEYLYHLQIHIIFAKTILHPIKIEVWIAMSKRRIIGAIFVYNTINGIQYEEQIL